MISVIVPIFNASSFLDKCIESILSQSLSDFELILINDGSKDNSLCICQSYAKKDSRIRIIDKKNEGVDKARFAGIAIARGKYVTFIDSDDWIEPRMLEVMLYNIEKYHADYTEVAMQRVMDRMGLIRRKSISPILGHIEQPTLFNDYYLSFMGVNILPVNMCGKLYRKEVLDSVNLKPSGLKMGEDLFFNLNLFPHLKNVYISDYIGYNYRFGGMTSKYNPSLLPDLIFLYQKKKELIKEYSYTKANDFIKIELVNVFKSDVRQQILFKYKSKKEIILQIEEELQDPLWNDIKNINDKKYIEKPFPKAIIQKDANYIYDFCKEEVDKERPIYFLKRIAAKMLSKYL